MIKLTEYLTNSPYNMVVRMTCAACFPTGDEIWLSLHELLVSMHSSRHRWDGNESIIGICAITYGGGEVGGGLA